MGNPLLDISAHVPQEVLDKYQVTLNNATLAEEKHLPLYKELVDEYDVEYIAGGATQNSIRVAQWFSQEEGYTTFFGAVGKDAFADQLKKSAENDGVRVLYDVHEEIATGTCAVLVKDTERSLVANLAAANTFRESHLDIEEVKTVWQNAKMIYVAGFFLTVSPPSIMKVAKHCADQGKHFVMNLAAPFIPQFFTEPLTAALEYCSIIIGNESEAVSYAEAIGLGTSNPEDIVEALAKSPSKRSDQKRIAVITQGSGSTLIFTEGKLLNIPVPKVPSDEIIDVNGAGDAFVGGFLTALLKGAELERAAQAGHYCAGVVIRKSGCVVSGKPEFEL